MIEKLDRYIKTEENGVRISCPPEPQDMMDKINELIDAVNKQQDIIRQIGECGSRKGECLWCDTLTEFNPENPTISKMENVDTYAEQQKWLGKLCKFWDGNEQMSHLCWGILYTITPTSPLPFCCSLGDGKTFDYEHCEPVKPTDSIIYKGDDNE